MLEVTIWSLLVGNLGWQAVVVSGWLRWREMLTRQQHQEEEEILTCFEPKEDLGSHLPQRNAVGNVQEVSPNSQLTSWELNNNNSAATQTKRNSKVDVPSHSSELATDPHLVGWEFKIVRAKRDIFHNPAVLQKLCQEEAVSGWILLEKLDDRRVRFKRLIALRNIIEPEQLSFDPYRCHYGSSFTPMPWLGALALVGAIALPSYFSYTWVSRMITQQNPPIPSPYQDIPPQSFPPAQNQETR